MIIAIVHNDVVYCQSIVCIKITIPEVLNNIHHIFHFLRFINCMVNHACVTDCQACSIFNIAIFACIMLLRNTLELSSVMSQSLAQNVQVKSIPLFCSHSSLIISTSVNVSMYSIFCYIFYFFLAFFLPS